MPPLLIPLDVPEVPGSPHAAAGQPVATGVLGGPSGRKEVERKMWGKTPGLGWDPGGSGGAVMPWVYTLNVFPCTTTSFLPTRKLQMAATRESQVSWFCFTLNNACVLGESLSAAVRERCRLKAK